MKKLKSSSLKLLLAVTMLLIQTNVVPLITYAMTNEPTDFSLVTEMDETELEFGEDVIAETKENTGEETITETEEAIPTDSVEESMTETEEAIPTDSVEESMTKTEEAISTESAEESMTETEEVIPTDSEEGIVEDSMEEILTRTARDFKNVNIVIDPGHGGSDPGTLGTHSDGRKIRESDVALDVSLRLKELFRQVGMENNITMTRATDVFVSLADRVRISNDANADAFVSVHLNSAGSSTGNGIETYIWGPNNNIEIVHPNVSSRGATKPQNQRMIDSESLAIKIQKRLVERLGLKDRGIRQINFAVTNQGESNPARPWHHAAAAVLTELGFLSNETDRSLLISEEGKALAAEAIYLGLLDYFKEQGYNVPQALFNLNSNSVHPLPEPAILLGQTTVGNLNVRLGNSTSYASIGKLPLGTNLEILEEQGGWFRIRTKTLTGWVSGSYVKIISEALTTVSYQTHLQNVGWQGWRANGQTSGTTGEFRRLEALEMNLNSKFSGNIEYRTHVEDVGWQEWRSNKNVSGTIGQRKRLEAIEIRLTGEVANHYDVYYRLHVESFGWLGWTKNGGRSGTAGYGLRAEAIEVVLVPRGGAAPGSTQTPFVQNAPDVAYSSHVQNVGWQPFVNKGAMSGTTGQGKRLEGIKINLANMDVNGGIRYRTHVENVGWQNWVTNGGVSGTTNQALRVEAIQIELTGEVSKHFNIYYRVHAENIGWKEWVRGGEVAGTTGEFRRLEAIEIRLDKK